MGHDSSIYAAAQAVALIDNLMVTGARDEMARREAEDNRAADVHHGLMQEVIAAVHAGDVNAVVHCPGFRRSVGAKPWTLADVLGDYLGAETAYPELVSMLKACCASSDPGARLAAQAFVAKLARDHADFHLGDAL